MQPLLRRLTDRDAQPSLARSIFGRLPQAVIGQHVLAAAIPLLTSAECIRPPDAATQ